MSSDFRQNLRERPSERMGEHLQCFSTPSDLPRSGHSLVLLSASDTGVIRNGGRQGARFAPEAILAQWKMTVSQSSNPIPLLSVWNSAETHFDEAQRDSAQRIRDSLERCEAKHIIHLGGGHDHIYSLLTGIEKKVGARPIVVVNIDAHADTRSDSIAHSGNPFRRFANETQCPFTLIQYGIHRERNTSSTLAPLEKGTMQIWERDWIRNTSDGFRHVDRLRHALAPLAGSVFVLSLDCDALMSSDMEAVSAVNPLGIPADHVFDILRLFHDELESPSLYYGFYEYNPLFDNLSCKGARLISRMLHTITT